MRLIPLVAACALFAPIPTIAQDMEDAEMAYPSPERAVDGQTVISHADPAVRITVPEEAVYIGAVRWPLYDVADAEIHAFVVADEHKLVERFYLLQFEQYLPDNDYAYDYESNNPETIELSGRRVHVRPGFTRAENPDSRPDSDTNMFRKLVADAGYRLPSYMATVRFVELFEPTNRKELLLLYGENMDDVLTQMGAAAASGREGITFAELMPPMIKRAAASFTIEPIEAE